MKREALILLKKITAMKCYTLRKKIIVMKLLTLLKNWSDEMFKASLARFIADHFITVNTISVLAKISIKTAQYFSTNM